MPVFIHASRVSGPQRWGTNAGSRGCNNMPRRNENSLLPSTLARIERRKVEAIEGAAAMSDYLAAHRKKVRNLDRLRAERLARDAGMSVVPIKANRKRKS